MKNNLETKKELALNAMDHYIECTKTLINSISDLSDEKIQMELSNMVEAVGLLTDAHIQHRNAMFEEHGWELVKD